MSLIKMELEMSKIQEIWKKTRELNHLEMVNPIKI